MKRRARTCSPHLGHVQLSRANAATRGTQPGHRPGRVMKPELLAEKGGPTKANTTAGWPHCSQASRPGSGLFPGCSKRRLGEVGEGRGSPGSPRSPWHRSFLHVCVCSCKACTWPRWQPLRWGGCCASEKFGNICRQHPGGAGYHGHPKHAGTAC